MESKYISYFHNRTSEEIFFGSTYKYDTDEIFEFTKLYLHDVVRFLFKELLDNERIFIPIRNISTIEKEFSKPELIYHFAGKYIILESLDKNLINEFTKTLVEFYKSNFPTSHLKYSTPELTGSSNSFRFTKNTEKFHELLPFPDYIIWAFQNPNKSRFKISEDTINDWIHRKITRIKRIDITLIKEDIVTFTPVITSESWSEMNPY